MIKSIWQKLKNYLFLNNWMLLVIWISTAPLKCLMEWSFCALRSEGSIVEILSLKWSFDLSELYNRSSISKCCYNEKTAVPAFGCILKYRPKGDIATFHYINIYSLNWRTVSTKNDDACHQEQAYILRTNILYYFEYCYFGIFQLTICNCFFFCRLNMNGIGIPLTERYIFFSKRNTYILVFFMA